MIDSTPQLLSKVCTQCNKPKPRTKEFFYANKHSKDGLATICKLCKKEWTNANAKHLKEYKQQYYLNNREKQLAKQKQDRQIDNPEKYKAIKRRHYQLNKEEILAKNKVSYEANRSKKIQQSRNYYYKNRTEISRKIKAYRKQNPHIKRASEARREARKHNLPDNFSAQDWQHALAYFNNCCAVCSRQLFDLFSQHEAAADHWIPLSSPDCPGTVPTNIVPLCHGFDGCNNRKTNKNPEHWLTEQFGKQKAKQILKRIQDYFASLSAF